MKTPKAVPQVSSLKPQASSLTTPTPPPATIAAQSQLLQIACELLIPSPDNPRRIPTDWRHDPALLDLAQSIRAHGVLQPLLARPMPGDSAVRPGGQLYDLRAGHRRLLAALIAGLAAVPVLVSEMTDSEALEITVTENLQRENLHPLEESKGVATLLRAMPAREVADHLGRPLFWVLRRAKLQDLTDAWKKAMNDSKLFDSWTAAHYERIARFPHDTQNGILACLNEHDWEIQKDLGSLEEFLTGFLRLLHKAPWKADDAHLEPKAGACSACPKRSSVEPELFDDLEPAKDKTDPGDRCLDPACWERKIAATVRLQIQVLQEKAADRSQPQPILLSEHNIEPKSPAGKLASSLNATVARAYEYTPAKKSDSGAVPAVKADGPSAGRIVWVQPKSWVRPKSGRSDRSDKSGKSTPVPLADRRAALQKRRKVLAIDRFRDYLNNLAAFDRKTKTAPQVSLPDLPRWTILAAALKFGIGTPIPENLNSSFKWIANTSQEETHLMFQDLLRGIIGVLHNRLFIGEHDIHRVRPIAKFLLIEDKLDAMIAQAETEIPEPKSWASLNPDGTPRKRAPKTSQETPAASEGPLTTQSPGYKPLPGSRKREPKSASAIPTPEEICIMCHLSSGCEDCCKECPKSLDRSDEGCDQKEQTCGREDNPKDLAGRLAAWKNINPERFRSPVSSVSSVPSVVPHPSHSSYLDRSGQPLFVSDGISNGESWATYYRKPNGSLKRVVSANLPQRKDRARAQADLELYAQTHKLERAPEPQL